MSVNCTEAEFLAGVGKRLRGRRETLGMSRHDLARASRVSERYIALIEGGRGNVSILLLRRIASALCRPPSDGRLEVLPSLLCGKVAPVAM